MDAPRYRAYVSIRWSSIHQQLGEPPCDLSYEIIRAARDQGVVESDGLDWKRTLPGKEPGDLDKFATDVAAMANTGGGIIVYGVAEEHGTSRAREIVGVDASDAAQRRLRQIANNRIDPIVPGVEMVSLTGDGKSVLVLSVPRSPDAPHMIGQRESFRVPYRDGSKNEWMRERNIEHAYRQRFDRQHDQTERLVSMAKDIADHLEGSSKAWLSGVARPITPLTPLVKPLTRGQVRELLEAVLRYANQLVPQDRFGRELLLQSLGDAALNPRTGLRRWIISPLADYGPEPRAAYLLVELHGDGSLAFAVDSGGWAPGQPETPCQIYAPFVENFAIDLVALASVYGGQMGGQAPMGFRIDLWKADPATPITPVDNLRGGGMISSHLERPAGARDVRRFHPFYGEVPIAGDNSDLLDTARTIASDILHQFGISRHTVLP